MRVHPGGPTNVFSTDYVHTKNSCAASVVSPTLLYNSVRPELVEGLSIFNNLRSWFDKPVLSKPAASFDKAQDERLVCRRAHHER